MKCICCESKTNDFMPLNKTIEYSGIEIAINRQGMLRARVFDDNQSLLTQDIVEMHYCPLCGKQFTK